MHSFYSCPSYQTEPYGDVYSAASVQGKDTGPSLSQLLEMKKNI